MEEDDDIVAFNDDLRGLFMVIRIALHILMTEEHRGWLRNPKHHAGYLSLSVRCNFHGIVRRISSSYSR